MSTPTTIFPPSSATDQTRWFKEEVHSHDTHLKAHLRGSFPTVHDLEDIVQESYLRIWKVSATAQIRSAKAFLFRVAHNVALDLLRRNRNSPVDAVGDLSALGVIEDKPTVVDIVSTAEKLRLLADALAELPPRGREIIMLCKIKGLTHREAAAQLGISERTVDEHNRHPILGGGVDLDSAMRSTGSKPEFHALQSVQQEQHHPINPR